MVDRSVVVAAGQKVVVTQFSGKSILDCEGLDVDANHNGVVVVFLASKRISSRRNIMIQHGIQMLKRATKSIDGGVLSKFTVDFFVGETEYTVIGYAKAEAAASICESIKAVIEHKVAVAA